MKIGIGNDHSALELKAEIIELLKERGHEVVDYGTNSPESCDYPVYGEKVGRAVASGEVERGILICGTGLGISLAANKVKGVVRPYAVSRLQPRCPELIITAIFLPLVRGLSVQNWLR